MSDQRLTEIAEYQRGVTELQVDLKTGAQININSDHSYIHQGKYFTVTHKVDILAGATNKITFLTGAAKEIHYRPVNIITSVDKLTFNHYEGSSGNSGGSVLTPVNRNRKLEATALTDVAVKTGVTVTTNGTLISTAYIPGSTDVGGVRNGDTLSAENEWVLKPSTLYTLEFINGSAAANTVWIELHWYEE